MWSANIKSSNVISRLKSWVERWEEQRNQQSQRGSLHFMVHDGACILIWFNPEKITLAFSDRAALRKPSSQFQLCFPRGWAWGRQVKQKWSLASNGGWELCVASLLASRNQTHSHSWHTPLGFRVRDFPRLLVPELRTSLFSWTLGIGKCYSGEKAPHFKYKPYSRNDL